MEFELSTSYLNLKSGKYVLVCLEDVTERGSGETFV